MLPDDDQAVLDRGVGSPDLPIFAVPLTPDHGKTIQVLAGLESKFLGLLRRKARTLDPL